MVKVEPPLNFDLNQVEDWPAWLQRFERFRQASDHASKDEETQVNTFIYIMGVKAEDDIRQAELIRKQQSQSRSSYMASTISL